MKRRDFVRIGIPALAGAGLLMGKGHAQNKIALPCSGDECGGVTTLNRTVINSHNRTIATQAAIALTQLPSAAGLASAALGHLDQWNYYVANDASTAIETSVYNMLPGTPDPSVVNSLTNSFVSYGVNVNTTFVNNMMTVNSTDLGAAVNYVNSNGLDAVMNEIYALMSNAPPQEGNPHDPICSQYKNYDQVNNLLVGLGVIWGGAGVVIGPVGPLVGAGFALTALIMRVLRPAIPVTCLT